jgi:hypothetical protein
MIKSFKDFDNELKSQKIYEAIDEDVRERNESVFTEDDIIVPELLSTNKFLLKITKIVLKRLENSGLGEFGVQPNIITIDGAPGVYFYNYNDETMNIVICRNTMGKHVYLFKEFNLGAENVADLVLSTKTLGFSDVIDEMIAYLSPNTIEEGLICEWKISEYGGASENDVDSIVKMGATTRQIFVNLISNTSITKSADTILNGKSNGDKDSILICDEVSKAFGKDVTPGLMRKIFLIFAVAIGKYTKVTDANIIKDTKRVLVGTTIKSAASAIASASGVVATLDDETQKELDAEYLAMLQKDTKNYLRALRGIYKTACAMCSYVKNDGEITDDERGWMETRCLLITGIGGVGKSRNVEKALKDMKMVENKDYFNVSSSSTAMAALYKKFYDYNGKLLIFDDSSNLFKADYQKSFWKNAFQTADDVASASTVALPVTKNDNKKNDNTSTYDPTKLTRQQRYFREIGESTPEDRAKWEKQRRPELRANSPVSISETEMKEILDQEWAELEDQRSPAMPTRFAYNGVVIIISNETYDELASEVGPGHWGAIVSRMTNYDLHPMPQSIWVAIKENIERERDTPESDLPSKACMVPRDVADEFIEEVERLLEYDECCFMTFRLVTKNMHNCLNSAETRPEWKERLEDLMRMGRKTMKKQ